MTKQEAIEYIKENCYGEWCEDEWREVHDMAIEALQHDCEKVAESSDDYITIKRQFVLDAINIGLSGYISDDDKLTLEGMGITVSELPPAQPEREILDELMDIMKEYYFTHRYEYDEAWENGFAKCMNLIPNVYMKRGKDR